VAKEKKSKRQLKRERQQVLIFHFLHFICLWYLFIYCFFLK
jgi:hypothetical protein